MRLITRTYLRPRRLLILPQSLSSLQNYSVVLPDHHRKMCCSHFPALGKLLATVIMTCTMSVHAQLPQDGWSVNNTRDNVFFQVWQYYNASSNYVKWWVGTTNVYEWWIEENKLSYIFPMNTTFGVHFAECIFDTTNATWAPFPDPRGFKPLGNNRWYRGNEHSTVSYKNIHGKQVPRLWSWKNDQDVEFTYANHAPPVYFGTPLRPQIRCPISPSRGFHIVDGFLKKYVGNEKHASTGSRELGQKNPIPPNGWFPNPDTYPTNFYESFSTIDTLIPPTWDWRKEGVVTDVKSQDRCGSCWAFAALGVIEGAYARKTHQLRAFSEQYLIDCAWVANQTNGCFGGFPLGAFEWIKSMQYLPESRENRYLSSHGWCNPRSSFPRPFVHVPIKSYGTVEPNVAVLKTALYQKGPLSVEMRLPERFYHYGGRTVFEASSTDTLGEGHAMVLVGYGSCGHLGGENCFLIKNSWGKEWGIGGYFYIEENTLVWLLTEVNALATYVELE